MLAIELEPHTAPLKRLILDHLKTLPGHRLPLYELRRFVLYNTVFKESQAAAAVRGLVSAGLLARANEAGTAMSSPTPSMRRDAQAGWRLAELITAMA